MAVGALLAVVASACEFAPADFAGTPAFAECFGKPATIGIGWHEAIDPSGGSTYEGTEGDDVVVIINGPVTFNGLGGDDLICVNDTSMTAGEGPITINSGAGDDQVRDRRYPNGGAPDQVVLDVRLGSGNDRFYGGAGNETVRAGRGDDEVNGGGGVDSLKCGGGNDLRWVGDFTDPATTSTGCENTDQGFGPVDDTALGARLDAFLVDVGAPGTQTGIRVPGQPDLFLASGVDDVLADPQTPMPTDGTFHIASITKTFTSAVILQLIEEGQLGFDDTLDQWLPEYPHAVGITVRMMLDHTSGMFSENALGQAAVAGMVWGNGPDYAYTLEELMDVNAGYEPHGLPGSGWHYSNANYRALGYIIEQITGQSVYEVFDQRIFGPYGLDDTVLDDGTATITQHGWLGSIDFLNLPQTPFMTFFTSSGSGVSTTKDLLEWGDVLYGGQFLGDTLDAELHTLEHTPWLADDPNDDDRYGLGVVGYCPCDEPPHAEVIGHDGGLPGTRTNLRHDTESGVTVAFRANTQDFAFSDMDPLIHDLFALVLGD